MTTQTYKVTVDEAAAAFGVTAKVNPSSYEGREVEIDGRKYRLTVV